MHLGQPSTGNMPFSSAVAPHNPPQRCSVSLIGLRLNMQDTGMQANRTRQTETLNPKTATSHYCSRCARFAGVRAWYTVIRIPAVPVIAVALDAVAQLPTGRVCATARAFISGHCVGLRLRWRLHSLAGCAPNSDQRVGTASHNTKEVLRQPAPIGSNLHREDAVLVDLELGASDGGDCGALDVVIDGHRGGLKEGGAVAWWDATIAT
jgi:hypothetical protein